MLFYLGSPGEVFEAKHMDLPQESRYLLLPSAKAFITKGKFGWILSQYIGEKDIMVWQHHFFIHEACNLILENLQPTILLNFMIKGNPSCKIPGFRGDPVEEGNFRLFYISRLKHPVSFIPGTYHNIHLNFDPDYLKTIIGNKLRLKQLLASIVPKKSQISLYIAGQITQDDRADLMELLWSEKDTAASQRHFSHIAGRLLLRYLRKHHEIKDDISILVKFIVSHIDQPLNIELLARYCHKSKSEVHRLFKQQLGMSPYQFIQHKRVEIAKEYLLKSNSRIGTIALALGFEDLSGFLKVFKKHTGSTPTEFRKSFNC
jgi:AraC-like DNA-binding protein